MASGWAEWPCAVLIVVYDRKFIEIHEYDVSYADFE